MIDIYFNIYERRDGTLHVDSEPAYANDRWMSQDARAWVHVQVDNHGVRRVVTLHDTKVPEPR